MKLLWFSHFIPYPPVGGAHQRSFNLLRQAARTHEVVLTAFNLHSRPSGELSEWRGELEKYCVSVDFWEMPVRWKSARWWARAGGSLFDRVPYSCRSFWSPGLARAWKETLARCGDPLIHFDSIDLALFAEAAVGFRKVLNHHNCESAMAARRAERERNPWKKVFLQSQAGKLARAEERLCPRFDVNVAVSAADAQLLQGRTPDGHFHVVENGTDTSYFTPRREQEEPNAVIFAASLNWYANISAVIFLLEEVWPLVRHRCPGVRLYLAGQGAPDSLVRRLKRHSDIVLVTNPEDIRPWIARASLFACPILDGGGTKLKILDAMAMGKAVISTSIGCEGLEVKHGENILIADTPEAFASTISHVLESKDLRDRLGAAGRALIKSKYSWEVIGEHLEQAYLCAQHGTAYKHGAACVAHAASS